MLPKDEPNVPCNMKLLTQIPIIILFVTDVAEIIYINNPNCFIYLKQIFLQAKWNQTPRETIAADST